MKEGIAGIQKYTEREETMAAEIHELRARLKEERRLAEQQLNIAVHELKNPLASITMAAELIRSHSDNPLISQFSEQVIKTTQRMTGLIEKTLLSTGLAAGTIDHKPVNLSSLAARIVAANISHAAKKNQKLYADISEDLHVTGDEMKLSEVIDNLVSNAIKYSPYECSVHVYLILTDSWVTLRVTDEGPGFTKEDFQNLFRPFTRLSAQPTGNETSTGLGLSIVKKIVDHHNGIIHCGNNDKNKGATFVVRLPHHR